MLSNKSEELLEKRLCSWYFKHTKKSGRAYAGGLRRWLSQISDEEYSDNKSGLNIKNLSRIELYDRLNSLCGIFKGSDITVGEQVVEKIIWDFQIYTIFNLDSGFASGIYLATEQKLADERVMVIQEISGFKVKEIEEQLYELTCS